MVFPIICGFFCCGLSFFAEVRKSEGCRRLRFSLASQADYHEDEYRYNVRYHLVQRAFSVDVCDAHELRQERVEPVQHTEEIRAPDGVERLPRREYDKRNRKPAESFNLRSRRPDSVVVVEDVVKSADTRDSRADYSSPVFLL